MMNMSLTISISKLFSMQTATERMFLKKSRKTQRKCLTKQETRSKISQKSLMKPQKKWQTKRKSFLIRKTKKIPDGNRHRDFLSEKLFYDDIADLSGNIDFFYYCFAVNIALYNIIFLYCSHYSCVVSILAYIYFRTKLTVDLNGDFDN